MKLFVKIIAIISSLLLTAGLCSCSSEKPDSEPIIESVTENENNEEILTLKRNIELIKEMDNKILAILTETQKGRDGLNDLLIKTLPLYNQDYLSLNNDEKLLLGSLVNNTKALSAMYLKTVGEE